MIKSITLASATKSLSSIALQHAERCKSKANSSCSTTEKISYVRQAMHSERLAREFQRLEELNPDKLVSETLFDIQSCEDMQSLHIERQNMLRKAI